VQEREQVIFPFPAWQEVVAPGAQVPPPLQVLQVPVTHVPEDVSQDTGLVCVPVLQFPQLCEDMGFEDGEHSIVVGAHSEKGPQVQSLWHVLHIGPYMQE